MEGGDNIEAASLGPIYHRLFLDPNGAEQPAYEGKKYFLTHDMLALHHEKLVETMAALANGGFDSALIMCSGRGGPGQLIDPELLDAKMRTVVGPAVSFALAVRMMFHEVLAHPKALSAEGREGSVKRCTRLRTSAFPWRREAARRKQRS